MSSYQPHRIPANVFVPTRQGTSKRNFTNQTEYQQMSLYQPDGIPANVIVLTRHNTSTFYRTNQTESQHVSSYQPDRIPANVIVLTTSGPAQHVAAVRTTRRPAQLRLTFPYYGLNGNPTILPEALFAQMSVVMSWYRVSRTGKRRLKLPYARPNVESLQP
jgi:hypothetical protein